MDETVKLKQKALRDREACLYWQLLKAQGLHHVEALAAMKTAFGMGKSTIYDKVALIRGYPPELPASLEDRLPVKFLTHSRRHESHVAVTAVGGSRLPLGHRERGKHGCRSG